MHKRALDIVLSAFQYLLRYWLFSVETFSCLIKTLSGRFHPFKRVIDRSVRKRRNMYDFDINATNLFPFQVSEPLLRLEYFRFVISVFSITCELSKNL